MIIEVLNSSGNLVWSYQFAVVGAAANMVDAIDDTRTTQPLFRHERSVLKGFSQMMATNKSEIIREDGFIIRCQR